MHAIVNCLHLLDLYKYISFDIFTRKDSMPLTRNKWRPALNDTFVLHKIIGVII